MHLSSLARACFTELEGAVGEFKLGLITYRSSLVIEKEAKELFFEDSEMLEDLEEEESSDN